MKIGDFLEWLVILIIESMMLVINLASEMERLSRCSDIDDKRDLPFCGSDLNQLNTTT